MNIPKDSKKYYTPAHKRATDKYRRSLRIKFFKMYGDKCECCGEKHIEFLTLEHKKNDGYLEKQHQYKPYIIALKEHNSEKYGVLCHNCNFAKAHGDCPHIK